MRLRGIARRWLSILFWALVCGCVVYFVGRWWWADRWGRNVEALDASYGTGSQATMVLLENESQQLLLVKFSGVVQSEYQEEYLIFGSDPAQPECRKEFLLPGDEQWVRLLTEGEAARQVPVSVSIIDASQSSERIIELVPGWMSTDIIINENGTVRVFTKEHGDIQPKRHLVYVETSYPLPLHVELPYADNEMPQGEAAVRMSWIGPGVESKSVQCAFPITANGVVKLNIPSLDNVRETVVFVYPNVGYRLSLDANLKVSLDQLMGLLPLVKWLYQVVMLG